MSEIYEDVYNSLYHVLPSAFTGSLMKASVLSALGKLDNDVDYNALQQEHPDIDFKFGFKELPEEVMAALESVMNIDEQSTRIRIESGVLSRIRDISSEEYTYDHYKQDDKLIDLLSKKTSTELDEELINYIKTDDTYCKYYKDTVEGILGVYKYAFQDSFGLSPYIGVLANKALTIDNFRIQTVKNSDTAFNTVYEKLKGVLNYDFKTSRQFSIKDLLSDSSRQVKYLPKKILEYVLGREVTENQSESVYKCHASSISWESYQEDYVRPQIEKYILEAIYYSLKNHSNSDSSSSNQDGYTKKFGNTDMRDKVRKDLLYIQKCLCASICIVEYNVLGKNINSIAIRIVDVNNKLTPDMTKKLFKDLTTNEAIGFEDGNIISEGKVLSDGNPLPFQIFEYRHSFNSILSEAEPEFGYKAVELYKVRGIQMDWNNILLGKDIKGTPLFASESNPDAIPMQSNTVHNMIAGSRSGKGVMTMNILASALAAGKPIFYLDRKPDMAVMFYELTGGNMFIINGGQYEAKNDSRGIFSNSGVATSGWSQAYDSMPDYMASAFFEDRSYVGNFGDYIYYRGILFTLGILMARVTYAGNPNIYENLGGSQGVVFVYDEYKNFQYNFESIFLEVSGKFGNKNMLKLNKVRADYEKIRNEIEGLKIDRDNLDSEKDSAKIAKIDLKITQKEKSLNSLIKPEQLYGTTAMMKLGESIKYIATKLDAGFKDSEGKLSDIFVIGQDLEKKGYWGAGTSLGTYSQRDAGDFNNNESTKGLSLTRGILDKFEHDYFMGYNSGFKKYIGANADGSPAKKWVTNKKYWAYVKGHTTEEIKSGQGVRAKYFKPYLVLNNNMEDDPSNPTGLADYDFVRQCRDRVNEASAGLWEQVRLKHLSDENRRDVETGTNKHYGELNAGVGFAGLAELTKSTVSGEPFNPQADLRKSFDIANYVAGCMGYSSYKELLFDFTPNGLFSIKDIVNAIGNPASYQDLKTRLPLYDEFGMLGDSEGDTDFTDSTVGDSSNEGGSSEGGLSYGGGSSEGGLAYGGSSEGGLAYGGSSEGGLAYGGSEGGLAYGGSEGGLAYGGGSSEGGLARGSWTDSERKKAAELLLNFFIQGVASENPQKASNLKSDRRIKVVLIDSIVNTLQAIGY